MRHFMVGAALATTIAAMSVSSLAFAQDATASATAKMMDVDGKEMGTITAKATPSGMVQVIVELAGVPAGSHGFHVHEKGICDAASKYESAGGHYSGGMKHGIMTEGGPHAGDLPNVVAGPDGVVKAEFFTDTVSLAEGGKNPLKDADGSAFVVHANPDDHTSQPSGEAGGRIACGVVE